ncbi:Fcf2 domain-containing protein [Citrus sinensis]|uniref:Fcf2 domain-containing protein n=1 Tax=Citrus sinensis TaxID=2711 RepID=A0ACB8IAY6_CITSI|nr:Fcf2 domain-containing protein [Citrus sinensis]
MAIAEKKAVIGLSWQPKLPATLSSANTNNNGGVNESQSQRESSLLWRPNTELVDGLFVPPNDPKKLNKLLKKQIKDTAGTSWFDMPAATITPELKKDLQLLKLRSAMDPKRHYKKSEAKSKTLPKLTKKERKATLADELLSDPTLGQYRKRKVREIESQNRPAGNDKWKMRGRQSQKRAKQRRH